MKIKDKKLKDGEIYPEEKIEKIKLKMENEKIRTFNAEDIYLFIADRFENELAYLEKHDSFSLLINIIDCKFSHIKIDINGEIWKGGLKTDLEILSEKIHGAIEANYNHIIQNNRFYNMKISVIDGDLVMPIYFHNTIKSKPDWNKKRVDIVEEVE